MYQAYSRGERVGHPPTNVGKTAPGISHTSTRTSPKSKRKSRRNTVGVLGTYPRRDSNGEKGPAGISEGSGSDQGTAAPKNAKTARSRVRTPHACRALAPASDHRTGDPLDLPPSRCAPPAGGQRMSSCSADTLATLDDLVDALADRVAERVTSRLEQPRHDPDRRTTREAAQHLGLHPGTLRRLAAARAIPNEQDGPRCALHFRRSELDRWREAGGAVGGFRPASTAPENRLSTAVVAELLASGTLRGASRAGATWPPCSLRPRW